MADDYIAMKEIPVKETQNGQYTNRSIDLRDIKEDRFIIVRIAGQFKTGTRKSRFEKNEDGTPKDETWFLYPVEITTPVVGKVAIYPKYHTHRDLMNYKTGDLVKLIATKKTYEGKDKDGNAVTRKYNGFIVEKVELVMDDAERKTVIDTIKQLPKKPTEAELREMLKQFGYTKEEDVQSIITQLEQ